MENLVLRPLHYASVSGGKDSLFMLGLILDNPQKYPLDMVVNFDLEIEFPVSKNVVRVIETICKERNVKFLRVSPRKTFGELYEKYGYPHSMARWCNRDYKLDCKKQLNKWIKSLNCRPVAYIGLCADETQRFRYLLGDWKEIDVCYPLAEEGVTERKVLEWARKQEIFDDYYKINDRMGCMGCPCGKMIEWAYLLYKYPENYNNIISMMLETDKRLKENGKRGYIISKKTVKEFDENIRNKWLRRVMELIGQMPI